MKGFESEVTYRFDDHWHAKLSMTYLDAKNELTQAPYRQCPHGTVSPNFSIRRARIILGP